MQRELATTVKSQCIELVHLLNLPWVYIVGVKESVKQSFLGEVVLSWTESSEQGWRLYPICPNGTLKSNLKCVIIYFKQVTHATNFRRQQKLPNHQENLKFFIDIWVSDIDLIGTFGLKIDLCIVCIRHHYWHLYSTCQIKH